MTLAGKLKLRYALLLVRPIIINKAEVHEGDYHSSSTEKWLITATFCSSPFYLRYVSSPKLMDNFNNFHRQPRRDIQVTTPTTPETIPITIFTRTRIMSPSLDTKLHNVAHTSTTDSYNNSSRRFRNQISVTEPGDLPFLQDLANGNQLGLLANILRLDLYAYQFYVSSTISHICAEYGRYRMDRCSPSFSLRSCARNIQSREHGVSG